MATLNTAILQYTSRKMQSWDTQDFNMNTPMGGKITEQALAQNCHYAKQRYNKPSLVQVEVTQYFIEINYLGSQQHAHPYYTEKGEIEFHPARMWKFMSRIGFPATNASP